MLHNKKLDGCSQEKPNEFAPTHINSPADNYIVSCIICFHRGRSVLFFLLSRKMLKMLGELNIPLPENISPVPENIPEPKQKTRKVKTAPQILLPEAPPVEPVKKKKKEEAAVNPFFPNPICSPESECDLSMSSSESEDTTPQPNKILTKSEAKELLTTKLEETNKKRKIPPRPALSKKRMKIPSIRNGLSIPGEQVFVPVRDKFILLGLCKICLTESLSKIKLMASGRQYITFVMCAKCVQKNKFLHANIPSKLKF